MKFKRLHIENIRSYKNLDLDFKDGVTVISGVNGSGKSSILEACFMGLFGGKVLENTSLKLKTADMIRKGSEKAEIILDFEHAGDDYQIEQQFRIQKKTGGASNSKSVLKKNGEIIAEQVTGTYEAVKKLLNMDEKNFLNCSYIRQGEVDALINAKPEERQQMIDDLLRLGKLEEYRERAQESKKAVTRVLRQENERRVETEEKITSLRGQNLHDELNRRREVIEKINAFIDKKRKEKEAASEKLTLLERLLKEIEDDKKEIDVLKRDAADIGRKLDIEISKREETLLGIIAAEKKEKEIAEEAEKIRKELNETREVAAANELPKITETNIELFISAAKEAEKKSLETKHKISE
ncbi:MAG: AAA family ATPase [Methanimicrococcus sp.]|nr:AAA family ATPase [Methanimicrococcus sp.]